MLFLCFLCCHKSNDSRQHNVNFWTVSSYDTSMLETPNYEEKQLDKECITKKRPYNITKYITICNEETLFPNSYAEWDKKRSQIISIYGCNPSLPEGNVVFFIIHWISDKAWTTDDAYMINVLVGYKRPSAFGVLIAAGCVHSAFDFLSKLRCQGTTVQRKNPREDRAVSPHSLSARDSGHHPDPEASPHLGRNPVLFTHPPTPHIPAISAPWPTKQPRAEGGWYLVPCISGAMRGFGSRLSAATRSACPARIMKPPSGPALPPSHGPARAELNSAASTP